MFTRKLLEQLREKNKYIMNYYSNPKSMFINGRFNPNNWNGGDDIIRQFTYFLECNNQVYWIKELEDLIIIAFYVYYEDDKYIFILIEPNTEDDVKNVDSYIIKYYKNRGHTDYMMKNGRYITENEYVKLLNLLERAGFEFKY